MSLDVVAKRAIARREARSVRVQTGVPVAPRDGTTLRADVYSPVAGGPHPCVLYRTLCGKTGRFGPIELAESIAARGYIVVVQDIRGRFASDGDFIPFYIRKGRLDAAVGFDTVQLDPERLYEYRLSLHPTSILFRPGHRVRIDSSSSDFPKYDRNHNTGNDWQEAELRTARQRVFHDANRASRVHVPTILS